MFNLLWAICLVIFYSIVVAIIVAIACIILLVGIISLIGIFEVFKENRINKKVNKICEKIISSYKDFIINNEEEIILNMLIDERSTIKVSFKRKDFGFWHSSNSFREQKQIDWNIQKALSELKLDCWSSFSHIKGNYFFNRDEHYFYCVVLININKEKYH